MNLIWREQIAEYKTLKKREVIALKRQEVFSALLWHNMTIGSQPPLHCLQIFSSHKRSDPQKKAKPAIFYLQHLLSLAVSTREQLCQVDWEDGKPLQIKLS